MAASASSIRMARAFVEVFLDDSKLVRGLRGAQQKLRNFGASIAAVGGTLVGLGTTLAAPFVFATKLFVDAGDALDKMSARTGVSVESLSALSYAAGQTGTSTQALEKGLRGMNRQLLDAERGSTEALQNLEDLGLTLSDLQGLSPEQQFLAIAEKLSQIEDPGRRAALAMKVFGKSGSELLPLLQDGAAGINALMQEAEELGLVMSRDDATAAARLGDAWDRLLSVGKRVLQLVGAALAPMLTDLFDWFTRLTVSVIRFVDANRPLIVTAAKVVAAIIAVGLALTLVGGLIVAASFVLGGLATILTTFGAILGGVVSALGLLLSPIGLVVAGLALLTAWFLKSSGIAGQAFAFLAGVFETLKTDALNAFGAIRNALAGGDIAAAAKVLWSLLKLEWARGVNFLTEIWLGAKLAMQQAWADFITSLTKGWFAFVTAFQSTWTAAQGTVAKGILEIMGLFDESLDVREAQAIVDQETQQKVQQIGIDGARRQSEIDAEHQKATQERVAEFGGAILQQEQELRKAREEFESALGQANAVESGGEGSGLPQWLQDLLDGIEGGAATADEKFRATSGTFSSEASRMFAQGDGVQEQQLTELKAIKKNTSKQVAGLVYQ